MADGRNFETQHTGPAPLPASPGREYHGQTRWLRECRAAGPVAAPSGPAGRNLSDCERSGSRNRLCSRPTHHGKTEMPQELDEVEGPDELIEGDLDELADDDDLIAEDGSGHRRRRRRRRDRRGRRGRRCRRGGRSPRPRRPRPVRTPTTTRRRGARRRGRRGQPGHHPEGTSGRRGARGRRGHTRAGGPHGRRGRAGPAEAARRVRVPVLFPRQAPQPIGGPEEDALSRLRVTGTDHG